MRSYLKEDDDWMDVKGSYGRRFSYDPDIDEAVEELEEFLRGKNPSGGGRTADWSSVRAAPQKKPAVPEALRPDFAELGVEFGAGAEECKAARKHLLNIHHPDRHA